MERRHQQLEILEDVHETLTEALKQVANEPSVGLYFVQQHVHKAVPALLSVKDQLVDATGDAELAIENAKDALSCIKTMKDCGPSIIEHMIKTLKSASQMVPSLRQSRGSVSQLLPRPVRPPGLTKGPLRSSSFLGDWHSDTSTKKVWAASKNRPRDSLPKTSNNKVASSNSYSHRGTEPREKPLSPVSVDVTNTESVQGKSPNSALPNESVSASQDNSEQKNWISRTSLLEFGKRALNMPDKLERDSQPVKIDVDQVDLTEAEQSFKQFQSEHAAKLEAWLTEHN